MESQKNTAIALYWVLIVVGFAPLVWLSVDYYAARTEGAVGTAALTLDEPLFGVVFILLFLAASYIAIRVGRRMLLVSALSLLLLGVLPAYFNLNLAQDLAMPEPIRLEADEMEKVFTKPIHSTYLICTAYDEEKWPKTVREFQTKRFDCPSGTALQTVLIGTEEDVFAQEFACCAAIGTRNLK